jgi:hypothetical protein
MVFDDFWPTSIFISQNSFMVTIKLEKIDALLVIVMFVYFNLQSVMPKNFQKNKNDNVRKSGCCIGNILGRRRKGHMIRKVENFVLLFGKTK